MEVKFQFDKIARINKKKIKCPTCKNKAVEPYIPFCSVKCSDIDLMKWLSDVNYIKLNLEQNKN